MNDEAKRDLQALLTQSPNASVARNLASLHFDDEEWNDAGEYAARALMLGVEPLKLINTLYTCCVALHRAGRIADASTIFNQVIKHVTTSGHSLDALIPSYEVLSRGLGAAIAADNTQMIDLWFRKFYPDTRQPIESIGVSPFANIDDWCSQNGIAQTMLDASPSHLYRVVEIPGGQFLSGWDFALSERGTVLEGSGYVPLRNSFGMFYPHLKVRQIGVVAHAWSPHVQSAIKVQPFRRLSIVDKKAAPFEGRHV